MPPKLVRRKRPIQAVVPASDTPELAPDTGPAEPAPESSSQPEPPQAPVKKVVRKKKVVVSQPADLQFAVIGGSTSITPRVSTSTSQPSIPSEAAMDVSSEIPLLDLIAPSSSTGSLSSKSSAKRKKADASLSFFSWSDGGEDEDSGVIDDEYDLSRVKELEARTLLNRGASEKNREVYVKRMTERLEEHKQTYVRPTQRTELEKLDRGFLQRELESAIKLTAETIQAHVSGYDPNSCNISGIGVQKPKWTGVAEYMQNMNDGQVAQDLSMQEILKALDAEYLRPVDPNQTQERSVIERVTSAIAASTKQVSSTASVIDFGSSSSSGLITELVSFILTGMKGHARDFLEQLSNKLSEDTRERPNIVSLHAAVMKARRVSTDKSQMRYVAQFVESMLKDAHFSFLLRYLSEAVRFKKVFYYPDSEIHNFETCMTLAQLIGDLESNEICGHLDLSIIRKFPAPDSINRIILRIQSALSESRHETRMLFIQGTNPKPRQLDHLVGILKLYFTVLLCQESGETASYDRIWDIYDGLAQIQCAHRMFPRYCELCKEVKKRMLVSASKRGLTMTYLLIQNNMLPYVFVFLSQYTPKLFMFNQHYWVIDPQSTCSSTCLKVAMSLLPLRHIPIEIDEDTFCTKIRQIWQQS